MSAQNHLYLGGRRLLYAQGLSPTGSGSKDSEHSTVLREETGGGKGDRWEGGDGDSRDWVGVTRPRRLLRRLGVDAGDDMVLW